MKGEVYYEIEKGDIIFTYGSNSCLYAGRLRQQLCSFIHSGICCGIDCFCGSIHGISGSIYSIRSGIFCRKHGIFL